MSEKTIKVSDRRMFTADGRLREEFVHIDAAAGSGGATAERGSSSPATIATPPSSPAPSPAAPPPAAPQGAAAEALGPNAPTMFELVALLAEPASIYLQQAQIPDGQAAQHLELARLHIDLLALLKIKTAGNLTPEEQAVLDDALYQLRFHYVEMRR